MDELQKLYDLLVREGKYTKSFDDFKTKWGSEQGYQDKVFEVVSRDGFYTKDKGSFLSKYAIAQPVEEVKKKEVVLPPSPSPNATELPLGIGSLEYAKPSKPAQQGPTEKVSVGPMGMVGLERTKEYVPASDQGKQGTILNTVSSLDKGFYKNLIGSPVKGLGTALEGVTGKGFVSDALIKFGNYFNKTIDELTPQDEEFKNSLTDQFGQAFGQVASLVVTQGAAGLASKAPTAAQAATGALAAQTAPTAAGTVSALKTLGSELASPTAVSAGLAMGQGEFERAKEAGATDEQAFEAFYKNAAVGSILEKIPVMQFLKRFEKASAGGISNYIKTKGVAGLTGGIEEMTTEILQGIYANLTAQDIYDANQQMFDGIGEAGGVGFGVGFLLNAMGANVKILRSQGKEEEAQVVENQMSQFESQAAKGGVSSYKMGGVKIESPEIISNMIDNMSAADLTKANIEIENDPELNDKLQNKIITSSVKEQVRQGNPDLNEASLDAITNLELELRKLEGNTTQTGKDKAAAIRTQIKNIQENQLTEEVDNSTRIAELEGILSSADKNLAETGFTSLSQDARVEIEKELQDLKTKQDVQKQTAGEVPVQSGAEVSGEVAQGEPQAGPQVTTEEGGQAEVVQEEVTPELTEQEQDIERSRLNDKVFQAKKNIASADDTEAAIEEYNSAKKELDDFESSIEQKKDTKRAKSNVEFLIEDENTAAKRGGYEYKELYDQDPRLAALQNAKDLLEFVKSEDLEQRSAQRGETIEEAKKSQESSLSTIQRDISDLEADLEANPVVSSKTQEVAPEGGTQEVVNVLKNIGEVDVDNYKLDLGDGLSLEVPKVLQGAIPVSNFQIKKDGKSLGKINIADAKRFYENKGISKGINENDVIVDDGTSKGVEIFSESNKRKGYGTKSYIGLLKILDSKLSGSFKGGRVLSSPQQGQTIDSYKLWENLYKKGLAKIVSTTAEGVKNVKDLTSDSDKEYLKIKGDKREIFIGEDLGMAYEGKPNGLIYNGNIYALDSKLIKEAQEVVSSKTQEVAPVTEAVVEEEQYEPITEQQVSHEKKFNKSTAIDYEEDTRETDSGREVPYLSRVTVEALDDNSGDVIGGLVKIVDEDKNVTWQALDVDGNELGKEDFDSLEEAKTALVNKWNKTQKKEFDKEAKRKAKVAEKEAAKKAKAESKKNTKLAKDGKVRPQPTGDRTGRTESSPITPLEGAPSVPGVNGPDPQLVAVAEQYAKDNGIPFKRQAEYVKVDEKRAKRIADAYEAMANDPQNPKVKEAYQNLIKQTIAQYKALVDAGYKFWFMDLNVPSNAEYASTPYNAIRDLRKNKEMGVFPTTDGYGDGGLTELDVENNPMLIDTGIQWPVGGLDGEMKTVLANDLFRAVHDAFGHGLEGSGFRARGEENAWQAHVRLFTGSAIAAITSETRGQNSWLNYGPNGEQNKNAKVEDTVFAEQKVGLMPKWTWTEGRAADMEPAPSKPKQKAAPKVEEEGPTAEDLSAIDALLDLDVDNEDNMQIVLNALDNVDKAIFKRLRSGANDALLAIPLSTVQLVVKTLKALVKGGMMLRDAIRKVATDNNVSQQIVKDILNVSEIQEGFDALMVKVDEMIARQTRRGTPEARMVSNIDTLVRNSEVYQNANDAQKKILEREARARAGVSARRAPSIGRILGVLKDITNVSRQDKLAIISKIRQLSKDAAKDLSAEIKTLAKEGKITANQAANIVARFGKVNMLSEISVSKFVDYMTKVFNDAEYASKLSKAKSTKKDIAKLSKNKDKDANLRELGKEFAKIDPSMVENIDEYNDMASKIKEAIKGSTIRGQKVSFAETVNIENATEYIKKTLDAQDKMMRAEKAAEIQSLMGIDVSDFSYEDMMLLLESDKPITKYNEGIIRDTINRAFSIYSSIIKDAISTGKDPFTGEDVKFTESQKDVVKRFMAMDLNVLSPKEALQAVDALANFLQNQSTARMEAVVSQYNGIVGTKELKAKGIKAFQLKKYGSTLLARFLGEQTTNLNVLFERMFKGFTAGGMVMDKMGLTKLINKKSAAQTEANKIVDRFVNLFYDKKANGEAFNSSYNNTERGMAAFMMRNVIGTEQEMKAEFDRRKGLIKESITQLEKGNDKEKAKAELYKKAYENILADSNTIEDVVKKVDKVNLEGINFWLDEWNNKYDQLSEVAENVYNKKLDKDINYTPDRYFTLSSDTGTVEISNSESAFLVNSGTNDLYQRETGVLMEAVRPDSLPSGRYIDLSFDNNNANSMYDALVDINTAAPIRQIEAFLNSPDFESVFPNSDDAKIIKGSKGRPGRIDMYIRNIRNKNPYSNDELASAVKKLNKIAAIGVGQALGGFTQPFKQVIPVMLNTLVNAKGKLDLSATFNKAKNDFINNSGYSIANRGIESQAQVESLNRLVEEVSKSKGEKLISGIEKLNKWWLDTFLVKPDVFIARASWLSYYEKYLKDNDLYNTTVLERNTESSKAKITTEGIDYNTHKLNEDAANYAQRMVDRQQNVSDSDLAGKMFASRESSTQLLVKTIMPFASFRMNQSARLGADLATLTNKTSTKEDKNIAAMSLIGFGVEVAAFRLVSIGISILLGSLAKAIMGIDEDDEEYEKRVDNIVKGAKTGTFTDILSPLPIADKPIQELGAFITQNIEDATELPVAIYSPKAGEYFQSAGLFGIAADRATQLAEIIKLSVTGEYTDDFGKKKTISSDAQDGLKMLIVPALMTNVGLAPSEVNSIVRYGIKDSKKSRKSSQEKAEKAERKQDTEETKKQKLDAFENVKQETSDPAVLDAIDEKIKELRATSEQKKQIEKKNKAERVLKQSLLVDPETGEEYDTETEMKRYNKDLWEKNFGENSEWYQSHEAEKEATKLLNKEIRKMEDEEYDYTAPAKKKRARNSDGTFKRKGGFGSAKFGGG